MESDLIRITQFLEEDAVDLSALSELIRRHHQNDAWRVFCNRTGIADPCHIQREAMSQTIYPDVSDILARKKEGRREISRRSLGEKIAMVEAMRERLAPLKRIREERRANRKSAALNLSNKAAPNSS
jgi:hypothetical protein